MTNEKQRKNHTPEEKVAILRRHTLVLAMEPDDHPQVRALMQAFNECGFVQPFDWPAWDAEAKRLVASPDLVRKADLDTCVKLVTTHVRADRFCGGHFGECGHILEILRRLAQLEGGQRGGRGVDSQAVSKARRQGAPNGPPQAQEHCFNEPQAEGHNLSRIREPKRAGRRGDGR